MIFKKDKILFNSFFTQTKEPFTKYYLVYLKSSNPNFIQSGQIVISFGNNLFLKYKVNLINFM